jgi:hypothetical protein
VGEARVWWVWAWLYFIGPAWEDLGATGLGWACMTGFRPIVDLGEW